MGELQDLKTRMEELELRLTKAIRALQEKEKNTSNAIERNRLRGKIEGVKLALGYVYEDERVLFPAKDLG